MEPWAVGLAKMFKDNENPKYDGATVGKVISPLPSIKIALGDEILLESDNLVIANRIYELSPVSGDSVILIPNGQMYYVIDKVGG
ncbi:DUF2577 family protein [Paenibacillus thailandensis]|uniref:DUF2577 family protein n=1 Tax=Paenibacillus thailandensis TaxID=393250 RepID=A0ABW5R3A5_9BACL